MSTGQPAPGDASGRRTWFDGRLQTLSALLAGLFAAALLLEPALRPLRLRGLSILALFVGSMLAVRLVRWARVPARRRFLDDAVFALWMGPLYVLICAASLALAGGQTLDPVLAAFDRALFGVPAAEALTRWLPGPGWQELFHLAYFGYYLLIPAAIVAGHRHPPGDGELTPGVPIAIAFFGCGAAYLAWPTVGPLHAHGALFPDPGPFTTLVLWAYATAPDHGGGALPSSHVAVGLVCVVLIARSAPRLGVPAVLLFSLMCAGTVYCSYHYVLDVPAGVAAGTVAIAAAVAWRRRDRGHRRWIPMRPKQTYLGCLIAAAVLLPATGCKKDRGPTLSDCEQACQRIADLREASRWWLSDGLAYDEEGEGDDDSGGDEGDLGEWDEEEDQPAPRNAGRDLLDEEREVMEDGQRRRRAVSFETCVEQCQGSPWSPRTVRCRKNAFDEDDWYDCAD